MEDPERMLILNMIDGVGSVRIHNLLKHFGSLDKIFKAKEKDFLSVKDIGQKLAAAIIQGLKDIDIGNELNLIKKYKVKVITMLDKDYPKNLKNIYDPPVILYVKGDILPQDDLAVAIVGSRIASFYGLNTAEKLGFELASRGLSIISGLARGIDSSAHKGALKAKGRTIAILGSGLAKIYPEEHAGLAREISESGAVISEFPMLTTPEKGNFPRRNRIISGLSIGVVVVEASEKSGALITSDIAMEQGRDVFAVPGKVDSVTSKGTNKLIKQGAKLVGTADDILEELDIEIKSALKEIKETNLLPKLDKEESMVYNLLTSEPKHIDELTEESSMDIRTVSRILLALETKRFAKQIVGKNYVKL